jgi:hypothetical protein
VTTTPPLHRLLRVAPAQNAGTTGDDAAMFARG